MIEVWKLEEKQSDVAFALNALAMRYATKLTKSLR